MTDRQADRESPQVLVLADSDSRFKWGLHTARQLLPDAECHAVLIEGSNNPSERQRSEVTVPVASVRVLPLSWALDAVFAEAPDVVILALPGGAVQAVLQWAKRTLPEPGRRPVLISGYVGVVYEKLMDGLISRSGSDLILANSPRDEARFRAALSGVGADPEAVALTCLPFLGGRPYRSDPSRPYTVTFAAQPGAPASRGDREYLLRRLIRHATLHPDRDVLLKLRGRPGEAQTHTEHHPYPMLAARLGTPKPPNLHVITSGMSEVLDRTDLLVTVSSTAAVEAMHRGIPTAIISDFGIREALGNHYYAGAGCYASFAQLDDLAAPTADPGWAADHGIGPEVSARAARQRLFELLGRDQLPGVAPFYGPSTAPEFVDTLLARYGLAESWDDEEAVGIGHLVRHAVRIVAKQAYRQGVNTVAPRLRKLAHL